MAFLPIKFCHSILSNEDKLQNPLVKQYPYYLVTKSQLAHTEPMPRVWSRMPCLSPCLASSYDHKLAYALMLRLTVRPWMTRRLLFGTKGVGERGGAGGTSPHFQKWGGGAQVGLCPPPPHTFGQSKCSYFTICSYFVVKNTFFSTFSWLASLANFNKSIFSKLC